MWFRVFWTWFVVCGGWWIWLRLWAVGFGLVYRQLIEVWLTCCGQVFGFVVYSGFRGCLWIDVCFLACELALD